MTRPVYLYSRVTVERSGDDETFGFGKRPVAVEEAQT
jgi:hypothetical protein